MKVTFILRELPDSMYQDLARLPIMERYAKLRHWATGDLKRCVSMKVGTGNRFGDKVALNNALRSGRTFREYSIVPRRGYQLASFEL